jgi:hypothetical protein
MKKYFLPMDNIPYSKEQREWLSLYKISLPDGSPESQSSFKKQLSSLLANGINMPGTPLDWLAEAAGKIQKDKAEAVYILESGALKTKTIGKCSEN